MKLGNFRLDISDDEHDLGFRIIHVENPGTFLASLGITLHPVIGYLLSCSDILLCFSDDTFREPQYARFRWGREKDIPGNAERSPGWHRVSKKTYRDPGSAIQQALYEEIDDSWFSVIPETFRYEFQKGE